MWLSVSKTGGVVLCDNRAVWKLQWQRLPPVSGNWHGNLCHAQPGDVVVADSAYGTYVESIQRMLMPCFGNIMRHCDFRRGKKLGIGDHIVQWQRPGRSINLQKTLSITSKHRSGKSIY